MSLLQSIIKTKALLISGIDPEINNIDGIVQLFESSKFEAIREERIGAREDYLYIKLNNRSFFNRSSAKIEFLNPSEIGITFDGEGIFFFWFFYFIGLLGLLISSFFIMTIPPQPWIRKVFYPIYLESLFFTVCIKSVLSQSLICHPK